LKTTSKNKVITYCIFYFIKLISLMDKLKRTVRPFVYGALVFLFLYVTGCCKDLAGAHKLSSSGGFDHDHIEHWLVGGCNANGQHKFYSEFTSSEIDSSREKLLDKLEALPGKNYSRSQVKLISPSTRTYNNHGYIFDNSVSTIENEFVEDLLQVGEYIEITSCTGAETVKENDIVVYTDIEGKVAHSGKVIGVSAAGVRVSSKWGHGPLYEHDLDVIPFDRLTPTFYRKGC